jgi:hypothetical protein
MTTEATRTRFKNKETKMFKTLRDMIFGALICAAIGSAMAVVGTPPSNGPGLPDGTWLNGLSGGQNFAYQYGITAAGTTQATSTQLPAGIYLLEIDTTASSTGVALPPCLQGTAVSLYNNGASTLAVYPAIANNPVTSAQDTINNGTSFSGGIATHVSGIFFCAKNGVWAAK